ncbi:hypothetical protein [Planomonospora sphaerica]|uniref:hypothetical protein n=1 Tax=Planomonospora sphaerica TaxID=161355 RepID=UPI00083B7FF4|nr:hypothetical protein [Planomonospora sphaerica]
MIVGSATDGIRDARQRARCSRQEREIEDAIRFTGSKCPHGREEERVKKAVPSVVAYPEEASRQIRSDHHCKPLGLRR